MSKSKESSIDSAVKGTKGFKLILSQIEEVPALKERLDSFKIGLAIQIFSQHYSRGSDEYYMSGWIDNLLWYPNSNLDPWLRIEKKDRKLDIYKILKIRNKTIANNYKMYCDRKLNEST